LILGIAPPLTGRVLLFIGLPLSQMDDTKGIISDEPKWVKENL
jgi:hypothetical protein